MRHLPRRSSRNAGLDREHLTEVVLRAHRIAVIAADRIAREGLRLAGVASDQPIAGVAADRANELAALGAAIAANSMADIEEHIAGAMRAGLSGEQLVQAASVAQEVQANAASIHARKTARLLKGGTGDGSSTGRPVADIGSRLDTASAIDNGHPVDPVFVSDPHVTTDRSAPSPECEDDCACHDEVASWPGSGAREQARAGIASDGERASEEAGAPWASMLAVMGGSAAMPGSCCAPAVRRDAPETADRPSPAVTANPSADQTGQP